MIIGYDFFGLDYGGCVWDTPICTDHMDELQLNEGIYDEAYVDLNMNIANDNVKPVNWTLTTIMDAKFTGDLDAGSVNADGFKVTKMLLYRTIAGTGKWTAIAQFDYDEAYNVYGYVDRFAQNGVEYEYAIVPVANEIMGDKLISDAVTVEYEGMFLTDKRENRKLEYDITLGDITHNTLSSVNQPISGKYPVIVFGNAKYRSGNMSVLPLSDETVDMGGAGVDKFAEQVNRQEWLEFLNNGKAKVLRMDNGTLMMIVTHNAKASHKGGLLRDLASLSFDYIEVGDIEFNSLMKNDLISPADQHRLTYDDNGGIISG